MVVMSKNNEDQDTPITPAELLVTDITTYLTRKAKLLLGIGPKFAITDRFDPIDMTTNVMRLQ